MTLPSVCVGGEEGGLGSKNCPVFIKLTHCELCGRVDVRDLNAWNAPILPLEWKWVHELFRESEL